MIVEKYGEFWGGGFAYNLSKNGPIQFGLGLFDPSRCSASYVYAHFVIQTAGGGGYCEFQIRHILYAVSPFTIACFTCCVFSLQRCMFYIMAYFTINTLSTVYLQCLFTLQRILPLSIGILHLGMDHGVFRYLAVTSLSLVSSGKCGDLKFENLSVCDCSPVNRPDWCLEGNLIRQTFQPNPLSLCKLV